jgi:hypothetical protein
MPQRLKDVIDRLPSPGSPEPHGWLDEAVGLFRAAEELFAAWQAKAARLRPGMSVAGSEVLPDIIYLLKSYLLLSALSLENLLKGAIIAKDPALLRTDRLLWEGVGHGGHDLADLLRRAGFSPSVPEQDLLEALTEAIVWSGRYPVHLSRKSTPGRILRLAKDRSTALGQMTSLDQMACFHRETYFALFKRVFDNYPSPLHHGSSSYRSRTIRAGRITPLLQRTRKLRFLASEQQRR